jgi:two-component system NtrC family response regulator
MKPVLLIVDDNEEIRGQMKWAFGKDYEVLLAEDRPTAIHQFKVGRPAAVLLDLGLPPCPNAPDEGMKILAGVLVLDASAKVIVISGQEDRKNALAAVGAGAHDFHSKPVKLDVLKVQVERCIHVSNLEREFRENQEAGRKETFGSLIGVCKKMRELFKILDSTASSCAPVLITGESGTEKKLVAETIHQRGKEPSRAIACLDCSSLPPDELEDALFGAVCPEHEGGASRSGGLIQENAGGTLFIDEIERLPEATQAVLSHYLQEHSQETGGASGKASCRTRIIAGTHLDLPEEIQKGTFREDLYYRLAVVVCAVPPLRDREDDVAALALAFLGKFAEEAGKEGLSFAPQALVAMRRYSWPGNIHELRNRVQRAVAVSRGKRIKVQHLELEAWEDSTPAPTLREAREELERELVLEALRKHGGKITAAASYLGISRPTFYELMSKLDIPRQRKEGK